MITFLIKFNINIFYITFRGMNALQFIQIPANSSFNYFDIPYYRKISSGSINKYQPLSISFSRSGSQNGYAFNWNYYPVWNIIFYGQ
jgi:hypothetical protein